MKSKRKILLFRPDNIGDVVLFSGAFPHIRKLYPDAHITLAVQSSIVNLMEYCPDVDRVISISKLLSCKKDVNTTFFKFYIIRLLFKNAERIYNLLFKPYDEVLYPVRSPEPKHLEILYYLSVKNVTGMTGDPNKLYDYPSHLKPNKIIAKSLNIMMISPWQHELVSTVQFLEYLGCGKLDISDIKPSIWVTDADRHYASELLREFEGHIIGLFPGASTATRMWGVAKYGPLVQGIRSEATFVIFGGQDEIPLSRKLEAVLIEFAPLVKIVNLAGKTTLRQLYCCISLCRLLISMDTAGLHMAITAGIPTVGVVGGGHYGRFVPWGNPKKNVIVTNKMGCFNCNWKCQYDQIKCISEIDSKSVASAVNMLLELN